MTLRKTFDTPILFLVFNRPETTSLVLDVIKKVKPSKLFVAADGPRDSKLNEIEKCQEVRALFDTIDWPCEVKTLFRQENLGCKMAVSSAITWFFEQVEYGIILEDDCLPDLTFFDFCSELLLKYENDNEVMMIGGNNFHKKPLEISSSYYFTNYPHIWGWATWRRAWFNYNLDVSDYENVLSENRFNDLFQSPSEKKYWFNVFEKVTSGKTNTWDYQWVYSIWKNHGKSITSSTNLIKNIGMEGDSTHFFIKDSYRDDLRLSRMNFPLIHPSKVINKIADNDTYNNIYAKSFARGCRLIRENSFLALVYYMKKKMFK
jgi:hypothetical protein